MSARDHVVWQRQGHTVQYLREIRIYIHYFTEDKSQAFLFTRAEAGKIAFNHNFEARKNATIGYLPSLYGFNHKDVTVYPD